MVKNVVPMRLLVAIALGCVLTSHAMQRLLAWTDHAFAGQYPASNVLAAAAILIVGSLAIMAMLLLDLACLASLMGACMTRIGDARLIDGVMALAAALLLALDLARWMGGIPW